MLDVQERIDFCVECLGLRWHKSQIKRGFWARFDGEHKDTKGKRTTARTIEDYLARARETMRQRFLERAENHADAAIAFLEGVIRSSKSKCVEKLKAQEQLTELLGLAQAQKLIVRHEDTTERKEDIDRRIDAVFGIVRRATPAPETNGHSNGNGHHENGANGNGHVDTEAQEATA